MWKVRLDRRNQVRPQLLLGLAVLIVLGVGVYGACGQAPPRTVATSPKPQVAAAFVLTPPPRLPPVDCSMDACLALTFDDGPRADTTARVLDVLARRQARATFFVMGSYIKGNEGLLRRMYQEGHEIGNHSWNHPHFTRLSPDGMRSQVDSTQAAIAEAGVPAPKLFRPPYGDVDSVVESAVPMTIALWNVDPEDWSHKKPDEVAALVKSHAKPGRVIVLHDTHGPTADALDQLVGDLQKDYTLVTFSELFSLTAGQPGRYYGR